MIRSTTSRSSRSRVEQPGCFGYTEKIRFMSTSPQPEPAAEIVEQRLGPAAIPFS